MKISGITIPLAALCLTVHAVTATAAPDPFFAVPTARELPLETRILSESVRDGVRTQSVTFRGADFNGKPTKIFAWYSRPEKAGKYPAVLQIHGAGLTTLDPNPDYAKNGFACLVIDWAGECRDRKVPRKPPTSEFSSPGNMASRKNGKWQIAGVETDGIRNGVLFARRALEFLRNRPEVDRNKLMVVGSSAGAHLTLLLLGQEKELHAAVVKYGCAYIRDLQGFFGGYVPARAGKARNGERGNFLCNSVARPAGLELFGADEAVEFIIGVRDVCGRNGRPDAWKTAEAFVEFCGVAIADFRPICELVQPERALRGLHFSHAPIRPERLYEPAESLRVVAVVDGVVALAVIFVGPHFFPEGVVVARHSAAFAAGCYDFVLAEAPCRDVAYSPDRPAAIDCSVGLRAVLYHKEPALFGEAHNRLHVAGPARMVHGYYGLRARRKALFDGFCREVLAIQIHVRDYRFCPAHDCGARRGHERSAGCHNFVALSDARRMQRQFQRERAVRQRNGVFRSGQTRQFFLKVLVF